VSGAPLACVQNSDAHNLTLLVPDQNVVIRQLRIVGVAWFLEVEIQYIGFRVVAEPDGLKWDARPIVAPNR
jgi:hypothetical protein